jgi:hypothetical protein
MSRKTTRIVRGLRLISIHPGYYSVERWLYPGWSEGGGTAMSLDAAVKRYLASTGVKFA